ncbi:MAG: hypothetical protein ACT4NV_00980 [Rhodoferax sp.]
MTAIVASIPGRLRLRHAALRQLDAMERLAAKLRAHPEVTQVETRPQAASLVVYYDTARWSEAQSHQRVGSIAASVLPRPAPAASGSARKARTAPLLDKNRRLAANRWAKRTMLGSLALSMALALQGAKRGHALSGLLFLHALGLHLWVHRRNLLK